MMHPTTIAVLALAADSSVRYATEIAERVGVSKQRVHQILARHSITRFAYDGHSRRCPDCGCGTRWANRCLLCQTKAKDTRHTATLVTLTCEVCGVQFTRRRKLQAIGEKSGYKHIFCGDACKGIHAGYTYGWGRNGPAKMVSLTCDYCHTVYPILECNARCRATLGSKRHYCGRACMVAHRRAGYAWKAKP